ADLTEVPPGAVLQGFAPPEPGDLIAPARASLDVMQRVLQKTDKMTPLLEDTLKEFREVARATNRLVPELQQTSTELRELAKVTRLPVPDRKRTNKEFQRPARMWGGRGGRLDVLWRTNETNPAKSVEQLKEATRRFNQVLSDENQKNLN